MYIRTYIIEDYSKPFRVLVRTPHRILYPFLNKNSIYHSSLYVGLEIEELDSGYRAK